MLPNTLHARPAPPAPTARRPRSPTLRAPRYPPGTPATGIDSKQQDPSWRGVFETAWRIELHSNFALAAACHQFMDGISGRLPAVKDGVNLLGNWHLNLARVRQTNRRRGGEHSLGNHAVHVSDNFGQFSFPAEFNANSAVAGKTSRRGEDQITQARQSRHGLGPPPAGHYQARHFGEAARDQRSYGIVTQTQAVADAGGDGHNIFQRAPEFHANHIVVGIDPKARIAEFPLHQMPEFGVT